MWLKLGRRKSFKKQQQPENLTAKKQTMVQRRHCPREQMSDGVGTAQVTCAELRPVPGIPQHPYWVGRKHISGPGPAWAEEMVQGMSGYVRTSCGAEGYLQDFLLENQMRGEYSPDLLPECCSVDCQVD